MSQSLLVSGYDLQKHGDNTGHSHIHSLNIFREAAAIQQFKSMNSGVRLLGFVPTYFNYQLSVMRQLLQLLQAGLHLF